jgi:hypothetical protein
MDYINGKTKAIATHRAVCAEVGASIPLGQAHGDWFPIMPSDPPSATDGQVVTASEPVKKSGAWYMGWAVRQMTADELETRTAQTVAEYTAFLEGKFDEAAAGKRYDSRLTCALRAAYPGPFQADGAAFGSWMDECNALAYQVMERVLSGLEPMPTKDDLWARMPSLTWPAAQ